MAHRTCWDPEHKAFPEIKICGPNPPKATEKKSSKISQGLKPPDFILEHSRGVISIHFNDCHHVGRFYPHGLPETTMFSDFWWATHVVPGAQSTTEAFAMDSHSWNMLNDGPNHPK